VPYDADYLAKLKRAKRQRYGEETKLPSNQSMTRDQNGGIAPVDVELGKEALPALSR
jgi:hypothetical protein